MSFQSAAALCTNAPITLFLLPRGWEKDIRWAGGRMVPDRRLARHLRDTTLARSAWPSGVLGTFHISPEGRTNTSRDARLTSIPTTWVLLTVVSLAYASHEARSCGCGLVAQVTVRALGWGRTGRPCLVTVFEDLGTIGLSRPVPLLPQASPPLTYKGAKVRTDWSFRSQNPPALCGLQGHGVL